MLHLYGTTPALGAAPPAGDAGHVRRRPAGHRRYLYIVVPKGFIPDTDNDNFSVNIEAAQGTSYYQMVQVPAAGVVHRGAGSRHRKLLFHHRRQWSSDRPAHSGRMMVNTKPRRQRNVSVAEMVEPAASQTRQHSRDCAFPSRCRRRSAWAAACPRAAYDFTLYGPDTAATLRGGSQTGARRGPHARLAGRHQRPADQDAAHQYRCSTATAPPPCTSTGRHISSTLYDAFGPQFASTIYAPNNQYRVLLEMLPKYQQHTDGLDMIYLKSDTGETGAARKRWPSLMTDAGPQSIPHSGQLPSVTISFALKPGTSLGQATDEIESRRQDHSAGHHHRHLPGHRQGLPGFDAGTWASC